MVPQLTPTVKDPTEVVEALQVRPIAILKGHGTVALGKDLRDAFLLTDLLEGAVHCQFLKEGVFSQDKASGFHVGMPGGMASAKKPE